MPKQISETIKAGNGAMRIGIFVVAAAAVFSLGTQFHKFIGQSHYTKDEVHEKFVTRGQFNATCQRLDAEIHQNHNETQRQLERMEKRLLDAFRAAHPDVIITGSGGN